ncbi:MAG: hypothetical protein H6822_30170 [Planctomycetaceae bacterium]|nr:hypothetical protein [Planctomycetales bacterium]MCB9926450.1 hypothetical protein [Planctomycetaceae bacterium]
MTNPFDDLAALVGRVLANRWLREQQSRTPVNPDAAERQGGDDTPSIGVSGQHFDAEPTPESGDSPERPIVAKSRRSLRHNKV